MCVSDNRELQTTRLHGVTAQRLFCCPVVSRQISVYVTANPILTDSDCFVPSISWTKPKKKRHARTVRGIEAETVQLEGSSSQRASSFCLCPVATNCVLCR